MEFEGVVFKKLPELSGTSARGTWKKQDVVFEIPSEFSRKICVTFFGDRAEDAASLKEGDAVQVSVNVESREYNGKWYTDVKAWKIVPRSGESKVSSPPAGDDVIKNYVKNYSDDSTATSNASSSHFNDAPFNESTVPASSADEVDDLPF